jgi:SAM-dependent methyltransferase
MITTNPWLIDKFNYAKLLVQILRRFHKPGNPWKVPTTSRDYYNAYDDKEQRRFAGGELVLCRDGTKNRWLPTVEINQRYLEPIAREIEGLLRENDAISVLEVGCGNCINLVQLKKRFGPRVQLSGFDISSGRLAVAKKFFGDQLADVSLWEESITEPAPKREIAKYDLVFSMHCLEQIPFAVSQAVEGLWKRARRRVVMVEPVWEFARPVQKLKLVRSDYVRTLLPTVKHLGYKIERSEPLGFESSQKNQSSVIVLSK